MHQITFLTSDVPDNTSLNLKTTSVAVNVHDSDSVCMSSPSCSRSCVSCVSCSTMALQQAQLLLNMSSLEPVNFGVQQNNTEAFAVALCHLAELHAEQVTSLICIVGRSETLIGCVLHFVPCVFASVAGPVQCRVRHSAASEGTVSSSLAARQGVFSQPHSVIQSSNCRKRDVSDHTNQCLPQIHSV